MTNTARSRTEWGDPGYSDHQENPWADGRNTAGEEGEQRHQSNDRRASQHQDNDRAATGHAEGHRESDRRMSQFQSQEPGSEHPPDHVGDTKRVMQIMADKQDSPAKAAEWREAAQSFGDGTLTDVDPKSKFFGIMKSKMQKQLEHVAEAFRYASNLPAWTRDNTQAAEAVAAQMTDQQMALAEQREAQAAYRQGDNDNGLAAHMAQRAKETIMEAHHTARESLMHLAQATNGEYSFKNAARDIARAFSRVHNQGAAEAWAEQYQTVSAQRDALEAENQALRQENEQLRQLAHGGNSETGASWTAPRTDPSRDDRTAAQGTGESWAPEKRQWQWMAEGDEPHYRTQIDLLEKSDFLKRIGYEPCGDHGFDDRLLCDPSAGETQSRLNNPYADRFPIYSYESGYEEIHKLYDGNSSYKPGFTMDNFTSQVYGENIMDMMSGHFSERHAPPTEQADELRATLRQAMHGAYEEDFNAIVQQGKQTDHEGRNGRQNYTDLRQEMRQFHDHSLDAERQLAELEKAQARDPDGYRDVFVREEHSIDSIRAFTSNPNEHQPVLDRMEHPGVQRVAEHLINQADEYARNGDYERAAQQMWALDKLVYQQNAAHHTDNALSSAWTSINDRVLGQDRQAA